MVPRGGRYWLHLPSLGPFPVLSMMVGAVVVRLTPTADTADPTVSNSSVGNDSALDDHKVMVAATVTILSGIIQVSTCHVVSPPQSSCPDWHISFWVSSFLSPPFPTLPVSLDPSFSGPWERPRVTHHNWKRRGRSHLAERSEHGSRERGRRDRWGACGDSVRLHSGHYLGSDTLTKQEHAGREKMAI